MNPGWVGLGGCQRKLNVHRSWSGRDKTEEIWGRVGEDGDTQSNLSGQYPPTQCCNLSQQALGIGSDWLAQGTGNQRLFEGAPPHGSVCSWTPVTSTWLWFSYSVHTATHGSRMWLLHEKDLEQGFTTEILENDPTNSSLARQIQSRSRPWSTSRSAMWPAWSLRAFSSVRHSSDSPVLESP